MSWFIQFITTFLIFFTILLIVWIFLRPRFLALFTSPPKNEPTPTTPPAKETIERLPSKEELDLEKDLQQEHIVGIAEPVGFWTKKILAEKLQVLLAQLGDENKTLGYWQKLILKQRGEPRDQSYSRTNKRPRR